MGAASPVPAASLSDTRPSSQTLSPRGRLQHASALWNAPVALCALLPCRCHHRPQRRQRRQRGSNSQRCRAPALSAAKPNAVRQAAAANKLRPRRGGSLSGGAPDATGTVSWHRGRALPQRPLAPYHSPRPHDKFSFLRCSRSRSLPHRPDDGCSPVRDIGPGPSHDRPWATARTGTYAVLTSSLAA